jgi:hypothetical protein
LLHLLLAWGAPQHDDGYGHAPPSAGYNDHRGGGGGGGGRSAGHGHGGGGGSYGGHHEREEGEGEYDHGGGHHGGSAAAGPCQACRQKVRLFVCHISI